MKMAKWVLEDNTLDAKGSVYVLKSGDDRSSVAHIRTIYEGDKASFSLLYNEQEKMAGYLFNYQYEIIYPKYETFNGFGIVYNPSTCKTHQAKYEVIFEDQVIRLSAYEHPDVPDVKDYVLVGRWRSTNNDKILDD